MHKRVEVGCICRSNHGAFKELTGSQDASKWTDHGAVGKIDLGGENVGLGRDHFSLIGFKARDQLVKLLLTDGVRFKKRRVALHFLARIIALRHGLHKCSLLRSQRGLEWSRINSINYLIFFGDSSIGYALLQQKSFNARVNLDHARRDGKAGIHLVQRNGLGHHKSRGHGHAIWPHGWRGRTVAGKKLG